VFNNLAVTALGAFPFKGLWGNHFFSLCYYELVLQYSFYFMSYLGLAAFDTTVFVAFIT